MATFPNVSYFFRKAKTETIFPYLLCAWYDWSLVTASKLKSFSFTNLKKPLIFAFYIKMSLIIKELIKHENKFNRKVFHHRKTFSRKASKSISWIFIRSLHNETIVKYVFHEMLWKKYFTVYPRLNNKFVMPDFNISAAGHNARHGFLLPNQQFKLKQFVAR